MLSIILTLLVFIYTLIPYCLMTCYLWLAWNCPHPVLTIIVCVVVYNVICLEMIPYYSNKRCEKTRRPKDHECDCILPLVEGILQLAKVKRKTRILMADKKDAWNQSGGQRKIIIYTGLLKKSTDDQIKFAIANTIGSLISGDLDILFYGLAASSIHCEIYSPFKRFFDWGRLPLLRRISRMLVLAAVISLMIKFRLYWAVFLSPLLLTAFYYLQFLGIILDAFIDRKQVFALDRFMHRIGYGEELLSKLKTEDKDTAEKDAALAADPEITIIPLDPYPWDRIQPSLKQRIWQLEQLKV